MNAAHIHLVLVHIPVVSFGIAVIIFLFGLRREKSELISTALLIFFVSALVTIPVYITGDGAEEVLEHLPGFSEQRIEPHEEFALISFICVLVTGVASAAALYRLRVAGAIPGLMLRGVLVLALLSSASLAWTAKLGGLIRHSEIQQ